MNLESNELRKILDTITAIYADHLIIDDGEVCIDKWGAEKEVEKLLTKACMDTLDKFVDRVKPLLNTVTSQETLETMRQQFKKELKGSNEQTKE
jgi:hypothetical protein